MKVQLYFKFFKNKFFKKVKSPISMRNGRLNTSKCRGKLQKTGVLYAHSPQMPRPSPNFLKIPKKKSKKLKSSNIVSKCRTVRAQPTGNCWSPDSPSCPKLQIIFFNLPKIFAHVVNSCWLAPAHARLAQTSPKNFKHP
jgi:hypothetical protein